MARPRAAVSAIASSTVSTPARAAAVSSPTLCPVMTTSPSAVRPGPGQAAQLAGDEEAHRDDEGLGDRGVLDRLGVAGRAEGQEVGAGDGAGPSEEGSAPGSSSQSVSIPGFCAPCPGARTASTRSPCQ